MPRERIYTQHQPANPGDGAPTGPTFQVEVAWMNDYGYVEVASTATDGTERAVRIVNDWLREAGVDFRVDLEELRKALADKGGPSFDGYHAHLDNRRDVNHLIRVLRKARDAAFGRDE